MHSSVKRNFVLVEDNPADARLFEIALSECDRAVRLTVLRDGAAAFEFLDKVETGAADRPDLLVLDLNLPVLSGWDVLRKVKATRTLRYLPVVILSSSTAPQDVDRAYLEGAASYVSKGRDLPALLHAVDAITAYWCETVELPLKSEPEPRI